MFLQWTLADTASTVSWGVLQLFAIIYVSEGTAYFIQPGEPQESSQSVSKMES